MTIYPNITSRKDGTNLDGGAVRARGLVFFFLIFFALKLESAPPTPYRASSCMLPKQESRIEAGYICSPVLLSVQPVSSYPISGILSPGAAVILGSHGGAPVPCQEVCNTIHSIIPKQNI